MVVDEPFDTFYRAMAVLVAASPCALVIATPSAVLSSIARAARGGALLLLGVGVLIEVGRRTLYGETPEGLLMVIAAVVPLAVNGAVLRVLSKYRDGDVHLRATWIFTRADVFANLALIVFGVVVLWTGFRAIDLIVGAGIGCYVIKEAFEIFGNARKARQS